MLTLTGSKPAKPTVLKKKMKGVKFEKLLAFSTQLQFKWM